MVLGDTVSLLDISGWYLVVLGQFNLVLLGITWYWFSKGLLCLYILKKWRFGRLSPKREDDDDQALTSRAF